MPTLRQIRYAVAKSKFRAPLVWLRHRGLESRDVFVASYPRSGSTWLRFQLFELLTRRESGFQDVNRYIPDVGDHGAAVPLLPSGGRLIKTHEAYRSDYKRAVYVVRDIRDVALSEYAYQRAQGWIDGGLDEFLPSFIRGTVNGYGSWQSHARSWIDSPLSKNENLLVIRYGDLRKNTQAVLTRILDFLEVESDQKAIEAAIHNNNVQNMRKKEEREPQIGYDPRTKSIAEDKRFVRGGLVGGWKQNLTSTQIDLLMKNAGATMSRLGFDSSSLPVAGGLSRQVSMPAVGSK